MKGRGRVVRMIWALLRSTEYDGLVRFGRCRRRGALAQLVERFVRNEKVRGSTPLGSTLQSGSTTVERVTSPTDSALRSFWERARAVQPSLPAEWSDAWAFGATPEHADELLELVLSGTKTGTASSLWDHEATGEPVPRAGELSVILDGAGRPRAVLETTDVVIVPFDQVGRPSSVRSAGAPLLARMGSHEAVFAHQPCDALPGGAVPESTELSMDARRAVGSPGAAVNLADHGPPTRGRARERPHPGADLRPHPPPLRGR